MLVPKSQRFASSGYWVSYRFTNGFLNVTGLELSKVLEVAGFYCNCRVLSQRFTKKDR